MSRMQIVKLLKGLFLATISMMELVILYHEKLVVLLPHHNVQRNQIQTIKELYDDWQCHLKN